MWVYLLDKIRNSMQKFYKCIQQCCLIVLSPYGAVSSGLLGPQILQPYPELSNGSFLIPH